MKIALRADQKLMFQLCISIWISIANGAQFCFGLFTPFMKGYGKFNYTQREVTIVATVGAVLSFCSLPTGYLYDRYGPRPTLIIGSVLNFIGWIGMYIFFLDPSSPILGTHIIWLCVFYGLSQLSASFFETGSVITNLEAFSSRQGGVIILQKTFMGLGSSVITTYYLAFFAPAHDISKFCLFLAIFNCAIGLYGAYVVRLPDDSTRVRGLNGTGGHVIMGGGGGGPACSPSYQSPTVITDSSTTVVVESGATASTASAAGQTTTTYRGGTGASMDVDIFGDDEYDADAAAARAHQLDELEASKLYNRAFRGGYVVLFCCMVFLTTTAIVEDYVHVSERANLMFGFVITALVLAFFSMVFLVPAIRTPCSDGEGVMEPLVRFTRAAAAASGEENGQQQQQQQQAPKAAAPTPGMFGSSPDEDEDYAANDGIAKHQSCSSSDSPTKRRGLKARQSLDHQRRQTIDGVECVSPSTSPLAPSVFVVHKNERSMPENMKHIEMWLLWYVSFCVWGAGIIVSNNSAQIYRALDYDSYKETVNTVYVSIFGVASALGRIFVGAIEPWLRARGLHISILFPIAPVLIVIGTPLFLVMPAMGLIFPFFLAGLATGVSWGSTILIIKSLFIQQNVGKHYSILYTAGALTPVVFSIGLFATIYDKYSDEQGRQHDHSCKGVDCVLWPLLVPTILNVTAIAAAWLFYTRIRDRSGFVY